MKKLDIKEFFRKIMVSLKARPHNIPFVMLIITYIVYSFSFENISYSTSVISRSPMGLCTFIVMLFSLLAMVSFLNAFPARQKPKTVMVIIFYVLQAIILAASIVYLVVLFGAIAEKPEYMKKAGEELQSTEVVLFVHMGLLAFSTLLVALIPVMQKLFSKIDTSVKVEDGEEVKLDITD